LAARVGATPAILWATERACCVVSVRPWLSTEEDARRGGTLLDLTKVPVRLDLLGQKAEERRVAERVVADDEHQREPCARRAQVVQQQLLRMSRPVSTIQDPSITTKTD
jgi:hypothetical protein